MNHLVENHSQRPNIGLRVVTLADQQFRTHVDGRSNLFADVFIVLLLKLTRESEVNENGSSVVKDDILWFDVSMHDLAGDQILHGF